MARLGEIFLEIDRVVAEGGLGFDAWRCAIASASSSGVAGDLHAAPAAARRRLDDHRIADLVGDPQRLGLVLDRALGAGHAGDAEPRRGALGLDLVAHQADVLGLRADEGDLVLVEDIGEARVLRQEAVAGMNGVGAGDLAGGDERGNVEIAVLARRAARCRRSRRRA